MVSIHAPRERCDYLQNQLISSQVQFQFTHPGRGATSFPFPPGRPQKVSIHAPRERCDISTLVVRLSQIVVSIHAPRERCDLAGLFGTMPACLFQFTHPGRGATHTSIIMRNSMVCFNSRTPGEVRHLPQPNFFQLAKFQFTHPGRGATEIVLCEPTVTELFQFTHPGRGATMSHELAFQPHKLFQFTHPGRGATTTISTRGSPYLRFNSRTPGEVRQYGAKLPIMGRINKRNLRLAVLL